MGSVAGADGGRLREALGSEDAFHTIVQWLYGRVDAVAAQRAGASAGQSEAQQ
jgi:hypothetical protein